MTTFEETLRAVLATRDPGPAPAPLALRVTAERSADPGRARRLAERSAVWIGIAAGLAAALAVVLIASRLRQTIIDGGAGGSSGPEPPPFDPAVIGAGIVKAPGGGEVLVVVALTIAAAVLASRIRTRWAQVVALVASAAFFAVAYNVMTADMVGWRQGAYQYGQGYVATPEETPDAEPDVRLPRFIVPANGILTFGIDVTNLAPVPITIAGLAEDQHDLAWGRITAVGLLRDPAVFDINVPAQTRVFRPVTLAPEERVFLVIAGRASRCALGRDNTSDPNAAGASFGSINVVYEVLGIRRMTTVILPFAPQLPMDLACMTGP